MFVGRAAETHAIHALVQASGPKIAVLYGRRRIGKTSLIRSAIGNAPALYFDGLEGLSSSRQIASFLRQAGEQLNKDLGAADGWEAALLLLHKSLGKKRMALVFDEFQWMANYRQELIAVLKMVWDRNLSSVPGRTLILCGSIASFMTTKVVRGTAFYGRTDLVIHLKGFNLSETSQMLKGRGLSEVLDAQCLVGGVPKYLELLAESPSVALGMEAQCFAPQGYFVEEYERIFVSHFGRNAEYERLVRVLAGALYGLYRKELAAQAGIAEGGVLSQRLYDLEAAGFIHSFRPLDKANNSRLIRYVLSDPWVSFYHAFLRPKLKQIRSGTKTNLFAALRQTGAYHSWMGRSFELMCMNHGASMAQVLGFAGIEYEMGPWFRAARKSAAGVQVDLMFLRKDHVITLCEMKRQLTPVGKGIIPEVERKVAVLQAEYPKYTIQRVLVTDGEISPDLKQSGYFYRVIQAGEL
jgi:uncharacterized protein